jgi:hypothetical protein
MSRYCGIDIILKEEINIEEFLSNLNILYVNKVKLNFRKSVDDSFVENTDGSWVLWINNIDIDMFVVYYFLNNETKNSKYISIGQYGYDITDFFLDLVSNEKFFEDLRKLYPCIYKFCLNRENYGSSTAIDSKHVIDYLVTGNEDYIKGTYLDF